MESASHRGQLDAEPTPVPDGPGGKVVDGLSWKGYASGESALIGHGEIYYELYRIPQDLEGSFPISLQIGNGHRLPV
jgi:hypothetical protein